MATITDINIDSTAFTSPLQLYVNDEPLIGYTTGVINLNVPNPSVDEVGFNNYLRDQINANANLKSLGIRAESGSNPITGNPELRLVASSGADLNIRFTAKHSNKYKQH